MEFLTPDEKVKLEARLAECSAKRPQITRRIAEARALGDLSENAEYHAAREDQGLNEAEIRRIQDRLAKAKVIDDSHQLPEGMVFLGATVKLIELDEKGKAVDEDLYRLVGEASGSFDADAIEVTAASPMGEALMKARVGEIVRVNLPKGVKRFQIAQIV